MRNDLLRIGLIDRERDLNDMEKVKQAGSV